MNAKVLQKENAQRVITFTFEKPINTRVRVKRELNPSERLRGTSPESVVAIKYASIGIGGLLLHYRGGPHNFEKQLRIGDVISVEQVL